MKIQNTLTLRSTVVLLASAWLTTPVPAQSPDEKDEAKSVVELSPFVVNSEKDTGYAAQDTLSGSRTRTSLKDVPNAISVFTADLMNDLAATNENDVLAYSASVVPELSDQTSGVLGTDSIQPNAFSYRIRGQKASRTRNYFNSLVPADTYNLDRFEEARGPNAILFGMGGAGGILNQTTKRANLTRQKTDIAGTFGSYQLIRGAFDHNQVIVPDKMAVRINAMAQDSAGWRPYEFAKSKRIDLAVTYRPFSWGKLYAEFEFGSTYDLMSRDFSVQDYVTLWNDNGRPTLSGNAAQPARGIAVTANQQRVTIVGNDGSVRNFQQTLQSTTDAARRTGAILDQSLLPFGAFLPGPGSERHNDFDSQTISLELQPAHNLFIELAADRQSSASKAYDMQTQKPELYGEPSLSYRDGTPNPYAGKLYFDTNWEQRRLKERMETLRATASYTLRLGKWGRHNLALMAQNHRENYIRDSRVPVLLGSPFTLEPSAQKNVLYLRSYVTNPSDISQYAEASWRLIPPQISVVLNSGAAPSVYNVDWINERGKLNDDLDVVHSYLASTQSYFFKDRLVASLGFRSDERDSYAPPVVQDPLTLIGYMDYNNIVHDNAAVSQTAEGLVFHATPKLSVLYNRSQNANVPAGGGSLLDGALIPISRGKGWDAGLMLSLFNQKVFARLAYFETSMIDSDQGGMATDTEGRVRNDRILDTMITDGTLTAVAADQLRLKPALGQHDLLDRVTTGWELGLTANPGANWRILFNASQGRSVDSNILKHMKELMPHMLAVWESARQTSITSQGISVAQEIVDFNTWYKGLTAMEGVGSLGDREWQAKFFNQYSFSRGLLKGWSLGGGWRYQSKPYIGANALTGEYYKGESTTEMDLVVGYRTQVSWFGRKTGLSLQLNGKDLLHRRDYLSVHRDPGGLLRVIRIIAPATYSLQAKLSF